MGLPDPGVLTEEPQAEDYELKLTYRAKSSKGVRIAPGEGSVAALPRMLEEYAKSPDRARRAARSAVRQGHPAVMRTIEASQWLNAHHHRSPVTRHALMVFETLDAVDPAFESVAICLLDGTLDSGGYPDFDGILGAVASYWDEVTGDQMVRGIVGWGGRGVRGDTERTATRILSGILVAIVSSRGAAEVVEVERPLPPDGQRPRLPALPVRPGRPQRVLLPQVRHAHAARLTLVPTYDYRCTACGRQVEVVHGIHATGPATCEVCGGAMRKALSTPAIHFKGSGWAKKDAQVGERRQGGRRDPRRLPIPLGPSLPRPATGSASRRFSQGREAARPQTSAPTAGAHQPVGRPRRPPRPAPAGSSE